MRCRLSRPQCGRIRTSSRRTGSWPTSTGGVCSTRRGPSSMSARPGAPRRECDGGGRTGSSNRSRPRGSRSSWAAAWTWRPLHRRSTPAFAGPAGRRDLRPGPHPEHGLRVRALPDLRGHRPRQDLHPVPRRSAAHLRHQDDRACSGQFRQDLLDPLLETVELFLFDIKHADPTHHRGLTGVSNDLILSNFSEILARAGRDRVIPRVPVIPGANGDTASMNGIISLLKRADYSGPLHLMPYNSMARSKWEKIGRGAGYIDLHPLLDSALEEMTSTFTAHGFAPVESSSLHLL